MSEFTAICDSLSTSSFRPPTEELIDHGLLMLKIGPIPKEELDPFVNGGYELAQRKGFLYIKAPGSAGDRDGPLLSMDEQK